MKVKSLDGIFHVWNLSKYKDNRKANASQLHIAAVDFLRDMYPAVQILEEVHIPGENLYLDIYMPSIRTAVECQGIQHEQYNSFFYKRNPKNFANAKKRDERKLEWCRLNNIRLVYFYDGEDEEQWKKKM